MFDRPYTEAQLPKRPEPAKEGLAGMQQQLAASLIPTLIEKLDGATLTFTRKEWIVTTRGGSGEAQTYEIIDQPTADSWRIKTSDGKVQTYYLEGERLASESSGDIHVRAYFTRTTK